MFSYKLRQAKTALALFFFTHRRKILTITASIVLVVLLVVYVIPPAVSAAGRHLDQRRVINRFNNLSNEDFLYDFEYLMNALEDNWPFFNLSVSANGVDVRALADNIRAILQGPEIGDAFEFHDLLQENFIAPINQLGNLQIVPDYMHYIMYTNLYRFARSPWFTCRWTDYLYEHYYRPGVVMFYTMMREARGQTPLPEFDFGPVLEVSILEEGKTGMIRVNQMINVWADPSVPLQLMRHYEAILYEFHGDIEGFEHLIIDLRGNPAHHIMHNSVLLHFDTFVMTPLLHEPMALPGIVFYLDGEHSRVAREAFDTSYFGMADVSHYNQPAHIGEPLPYLDTHINFHHSYEPFYVLGIEYEFAWGMDIFAFSLRDEVLFDGKVWLLTDGDTASKAEAATAALKYSNFATVVGDATRGIMEITYVPDHAYLSLPNTGILLSFNIAYYTDMYGRPLQGFGIIPHYPNRPGMDALETVLAMIAEVPR